ELGPRVEALVPVSAKQALAGQGGRMEELRAVLELRFFSRAQKIQRAAARERLARLLAQARARTPTPRATRAEEHARVTEAQQQFRLRFLPAERARVRAQADAAYRSAAREVLEFVRPRSWPLGAHSAQP